MRRVALQARVARDQHLRMIGQALRQDHGVLLRTLQPDRQRSRAPDSEKRLQRAGCRAGQFACLPQRGEQRRAADRYHAAEQVGVPADELRHRLHREIGAE